MQLYDSKKRDVLIIHNVGVIDIIDEGFRYDWYTSVQL